MTESKLSVEDANAFLTAGFKRANGAIRVISMAPGRAVMDLDISDDHLRPGGYISGSSQMLMADSAAYMAVMTRTGLTPMAVTSNLNINFLRPCIGSLLIADATLIKLGTSLAVIEVDLRSDSSEKASSHAIVTYALPKEA